MGVNMGKGRKVGAKKQQQQQELAARKRQDKIELAKVRLDEESKLACLQEEDRRKIAIQEGNMLLQQDVEDSAQKIQEDAQDAILIVKHKWPIQKTQVVVKYDDTTQLVSFAFQDIEVGGLINLKMEKVSGFSWRSWDFFEMSRGYHRECNSMHVHGQKCDNGEVVIRFSSANACKDFNNYFHIPHLQSVSEDSIRFDLNLSGEVVEAHIHVNPFYY
jgi:hypothetical protein